MYVLYQRIKLNFKIQLLFLCRTASNIVTDSGKIVVVCSFCIVFTTPHCVEDIGSKIEWIVVHFAVLLGEEVLWEQAIRHVSSDGISSNTCINKV